MLHDRFSAVQGQLLVHAPSAFTPELLNSLVDSMLSALGKQRCEIVILDLSNTDYLDQEEFYALKRLAHMVELMGPQLVLVGLNAGIVRYLIDANVDTSELLITRDIEQALQIHKTKIT